MTALLETRKLKKYFGETHAVDEVDFSIVEGEVLSLIGSNGAGKTSLVNLISGLFPPDSGEILFRGEDVTRASVHGRIA
ncbi:MAG TPA: ATP-binding cassette domain-containing protein, partial [Myxococcales bacterium]